VVVEEAQLLEAVELEVIEHLFQVQIVMQALFQFHHKHIQSQ
jgi:hypothetical protein